MCMLCKKHHHEKCSRAFLDWRSLDNLCVWVLVYAWIFQPLLLST